MDLMLGLLLMFSYFRLGHGMVHLSLFMVKIWVSYRTPMLLYIRVRGLITFSLHAYCSTTASALFRCPTLGAICSVKDKMYRDRTSLGVLRLPNFFTSELSPHLTSHHHRTVLRVRLPAGTIPKWGRADRGWVLQSMYDMSAPM